GHDAAACIPADEHGAAAELGVVALLDGRVERVHVDVDDVSYRISAGVCRAITHSATRAVAARGRKREALAVTQLIQPDTTEGCRPSAASATAFTWTMARRRSVASFSKRPAYPKPALLTSTPISRRATALASRSAPSGAARSAGTTRVATRQVSSSSRARARRRSSRRAVSTQDMPRVASARANSPPIPAEAPVTSAHSPYRCRKDAVSAMAVV